MSIARTITNLLPRFDESEGADLVMRKFPIEKGRRVDKPHSFCRPR